jgi:hypothetical protein
MRCREALQEQRGIKRKAIDLAKAAGQPDEIGARKLSFCHSPPQKLASWLER